MKKLSVLFVCMGNICRSPTAEGVFRSLVQKEGLGEWFEIDSAGTHDYHAGNPPDERAQKAASNRGINLGELRARQVVPSDFEFFDHILVMDKDNYHMMMFACPEVYTYKIRLFLDYVPSLKIKEVPDPYYGGPRGFEQVLDLVEQAAISFLDSVRGNL